MKLNEWISKADQAKLLFIKKYDHGLSPLDDLTHLPFIHIKRDIPNLFSEGNFDEAFVLILQEPLEKILKKDEMERFRLLVWVEKQYKRINEIEKKYLERPPDFKMLAAGIKNLDVLGILNTTSLVAREFGYKIEEVEQLPYGKVFDLQLKLAIDGDIQKKLLEQNQSDAKSKRKK